MYIYFTYIYLFQEESLCDRLSELVTIRQENNDLQLVVYLYM